mmetsp:Transcript_5068/g.12436  ORF Transcript_5068/g.12436 Transcript_5068/m.12436 type:complete len:928 (-) Transcript_5068:180-2963(-)|eukprot:CAMPEP_0172402812 /NCGR_PEP_ID=MMETSP1061-20121228/56180_1 /TAXON_ID=37318 /ORGANISM="Pseudo-nitzschia pungens, Strain cf. pungens" /LENGTH=927 /DNA_ID=CAMNT_0013136941 /DNA_START=575 /DNA_END=3361 /DNA_ORIENTATION=-
MRDISQYTSRLPSPSYKRGTKNVAGGQQQSTPQQPNRTLGATTPTRIPAKNTSPGEQKNNGTQQNGTGGAGKSAVPVDSSVIQNLRQQLEEATARDASARAALTKSDAVILDLRSNQRQLKKQLELLQDERSQINKELQSAKEEIASAKGGDASGSNAQRRIESLQVHIRDITQQLENSHKRQQEQQQEINSSIHSRSSIKDGHVGELQVQLDRAHAQILTADMVRKELEDTLEAEQYTWELRIQDQERQITKLQGECDTLVKDLEQCRSQWKEAEVGWNEELNELRSDLDRTQRQLQQQRESNEENNENNHQNNELFEKIHKLESERAELQSCLDEALKELEAVDAELQVEGSLNKAQNGAGAQTIESLKHLLRWIYQEGPTETRLGHGQLSSLGNDSQKIISMIQEALERWLEKNTRAVGGQNARSGAGNDLQNRATIDKLNSQIAVFESELKSRDDVNTELRESLKEAVSLLKPLQDAVSQAEVEKNDMERVLKDFEKDRKSSQDAQSRHSFQIDSLKEEITELQERLEEEKRLATVRESVLKAQVQTAPSSFTSDTSLNLSNDDSESLMSIKRTREELRRKRESEGNLQKLLKDAQSRFTSLHDQNEDISARNRELEGQIRKFGSGSGSDNGQNNEEEEVRTQLVETIAEKDEEIRRLRLDMEEMRKATQNQFGQNISYRRISSLEEELAAVRGDVAQREQANKLLNKSLKEALGLLKPLQLHLEEAENEKSEIARELRNLKKRFRQLQMGELDDQSRSTITGVESSFELSKVKEELEETIRQLELENSELHDALEDLAEDGRQQNNEAKVRQRLVELNSRYEVTQNKLEDAHVENHALVKALKQKEIEEVKRKSDMIQLEGKLHKAESELVNAKKIAQSALVKVEELTMTNVQQLSVNRDTVDNGGNAKGRSTNGRYTGSYN